MYAKQQKTIRIACIYGELFIIGVRLDVFHFMRRFTNGLTTEHRPLFGTFWIHPFHFFYPRLGIVGSWFCLGGICMYTCVVYCCVVCMYAGCWNT